MKYIRERDEFLKKIKNIGLLLENENAGPFANDIPWGDSLVGRLINAVRRKIGVGTNILNINKLLKRLRLEFDNILLYAAFGELTDEQKKMVGSAILYEILLIIQIGIYEKLNKGFSSEGSPTKIEDKDYLKELESMITEAIQFIGETSDKYIIENADKANTELKKLIELIKKLKLEEDNDKPEEEKPTEEKTDLNIDDIVVGKEYYFNGKDGKKTIKILNKDTSDNSKVYVLLKSGDGKYPEKSSGNAVSISKLSEINDKKETPDNTETNDSPEYKKYKGYKVQLQNMINSRNTNKERGNDTKGEDHEIENMKATIRTMNQKYKFEKEEVKQLTSGSGATHSAPESGVVANKKDEENKKEFNRGGSRENSSRKYLYGYEEFIYEITMPNLEPNSDSNNNRGSEEHRKEETGNKLQNTDKGEEKPTQGEEKPTQGEETQDKKSHQDQLKEFWEINFIKTKLMRTKEEIEKLKPELDKIEETEEGVFVINGIDPVIEIVKLFNRAYKIHTSKMIPGARSGGKVARGVWDQYTAFGDRGGEQPNAVTQGPYRNNKVFNIWENAVLDIMKERKYQPIFDPKTKLKVGNKKKEGAGALLRKLIVDFLDGEKMYKGESGQGKGGVQKQFLDKYFGDVAGDELENAGLGFTKDEVSANAKLSNEIPTLLLKFEKIDIPKNLRRMFFRIKGKDGDNMDTTKYFFVQEAKGDMVSIVYSKKFGDFKKYILFGLRNDKGELNPIPSFNFGIDDATSEIYATKIKMDKLTKLIKGEEQVELTGKNTNKEEKTTKLKAAESTLWLMNSDKKEIFKLLKFNFFDAKAKGFRTDQEKEWGETK